MKKIIFSIGVALLIFCSCNEDNINQPYGPNDGIAPGKITNVTYTPIPGGAIIDYTNPADDDLLYVKACYTLSTGKKMEARVSGYEKSLMIEGFNDVDAKVITIYAVDRHENVGSPVSFKLVPGISPLMSAFTTVDISVAFGGVYVNLVNENKGNLIVDVITKDAYEQWQSVNTLYTASKNVLFSTRGFGPEERVFGVCLRDRWDNVTDTLFKKVTPLEEYKLNKGLFRKVALANDLEMGGWNLVLENAWDDSHVWNPGDDEVKDFAHSADKEIGPTPWMLTIDLGVQTKLSRYIFYQRQKKAFLFNDGDPKTWEIYGRTDTPPADGSWDGWTLLRSCENLKKEEFVNNDMIEQAKKGLEFDIPMDSPEVRYVRIKFITSYGFRLFFSELTFYGQV